MELDLLTSRTGVKATTTGKPALALKQKGFAMRMRSVLVLSLMAASLAPAPPLPSSIAGIGDSITRATDVCCWYGDHSAQSWSTGGGAFDGISSHYERIRTLNPAIQGRNFSDARAGARMRDAQAQAQTAVTQAATSRS